MADALLVKRDLTAVPGVSRLQPAKRSTFTATSASDILDFQVTPKPSPPALQPPGTTVTASVEFYRRTGKVLVDQGHNGFDADEILFINETIYATTADNAKIAYGFAKAIAATHQYRRSEDDPRYTSSTVWRSQAQRASVPGADAAMHVRKTQFSDSGNYPRGPLESRYHGSGYDELIALKGRFILEMTVEREYIQKGSLSSRGRVSISALALPDDATRQLVAQLERRAVAELALVKEPARGS